MKQIMQIIFFEFAKSYFAYHVITNWHIECEYVFYLEWVGIVTLSFNVINMVSKNKKQYLLYMCQWKIYLTN